jgi:hypothetical protein
MALILKKKYTLSTVITIIMCAVFLFSDSVKATPIPCTVFSNPVQVTYPGTLDICETKPGGWFGCTVGFLCCPPDFVTQISQNEFSKYRSDFIMSSFYTNTVEPNYKSVADEVRNPALFSIAAWGAFIDASILNDTLNSLRILTAQSHRTYTPSEQICKIGTLTRSLSASEARVDNDRLVLGELGLAKNLGRKSSISAAGGGQESNARLEEFVEQFCDLKTNNNGMKGMCQTATPVKDLQLNRDIDYTRLMGNGVTINADMTDNSLTQDESNLIALSHYLYGHKQPSERLSKEQLESSGSQNLYAEYRSVDARRAAAQNSYNTLAAMKMAGSGGSDAYIKDVLSYIGMSGADVDVFVGGKNPDYAAVKSSYNAQMNLLTKQIYQDPSFYANLMDSKSNVKRTSAALQGIGLMQQRDTYKSMARSEMLTALLVELEARKIANNVTGTKTK